MKLILLRHGDRGPGYGDVALSAEGAAQAQKLAGDSQLLKVDVVYTSPKLRTRQTITPLCEVLGRPAVIEVDLDQRKSIESSQEFTLRVLSYIEGLPERHANQTVLICSHSDWLQTAILNIPSSHSDMAIHCFFGCADYRTLRQVDGLWEVV